MRLSVCETPLPHPRPWLSLAFAIVAAPNTEAAIAPAAIVVVITRPVRESRIFEIMSYSLGEISDQKALLTSE
jgi:hypothetical protein